jgi:hypothetical protein
VLIGGPSFYGAGWVGLCIKAFRQSILWGVLVLLIPPITVGFAFCHWRTARFPALCLFTGLGLIGIRYILLGLAAAWLSHLAP